MMFDRLLTEFIEALRRSIFLSIGAPENHDLNWDVLAAKLLSKLVIIIVLITLFGYSVAGYAG